MVQKVFMDLVTNHKKMIVKSFDNAGLNSYPMRVWGGHDGMECSEAIRNACNAEFVINAQSSEKLPCFFTASQQPKTAKSRKRKLAKSPKNTLFSYFNKKQRIV